MKNYTRIVLALVAIIAMFSLTSCNTDENPLGSTSPMYQNTALASSVFESNPVGVVSPVALSINDDIVALDGVPSRDHLGYGPLGFALSRLTLTAEQIAGIQAAATAYKDCITLATATVREAEKAIMDQLKADVKLITDQVKAGTLDRAAAREQIKALKDAAKLAIEAIPGREEAKAAAADCLTTYNTTVRGLLTAEQITALDEAIANRGKGHDGKGKGHDGKGKDDKGHDDKGKGHGKTSVVGPLGKILGELNLDATQITAVTTLATSFKDCHEAAMAPIREAENAIMLTLKATRDQIRTDLKAGTIDEATAKANWEAAEATAKEAMANIPGRAEAEAAATNCFNTYLAGVKSTLTAEQLAKFEELYAKIKISTRP